MNPSQFSVSNTAFEPYFYPFTSVLRKIERDVTQKFFLSREQAVDYVLPRMFSEWSDLDDRYRNSACFLQKPHNCSFEHERARKQPTTTNEAKDPHRISSEHWEQIKIAYISGIALREIARKMNVPEGTVLAHAKRHGWTQQIQVATELQSDAITPVQSVPQSLAAILSERKERTKLGLSKFTAEAAEQAAEHRDKLGIAGKVKDVADVHKMLWPNQSETNQILNLGVLIGDIRPTPPERIESEQA
jgi:hypothetical protein